MSLQLNKLLVNTFSIKAWSLIFAISWWYVISSFVSGIATYTVPIVFYNITEDAILNAPEQITITLSGSRTLLRSIESESLTWYVNGELLQEGPNSIYPTHHDLALPQAIMLKTYTPLNITVTQHTEAL